MAKIEYLSQLASVNACTCYPAGHQAQGWPARKHMLPFTELVDQLAET